MTLSKRFKAAVSVAIVAALSAASGAAYAEDISGTITATKVITDNSRLTGDVLCKTTGVPCIQFGASGIRLRFDGHAMRGQGSRLSCTLLFGESAVDTGGKNNVAVLGPGLISNFNDIGVRVSGNDSEVERLAITGSCREGIRLLGSNNEAEANTVTRSSLSGLGFAGIFLSGSGGHRVTHNEVVGGGPYPIPAGQRDFGIFVGQPGVPSNNNLIAANNASGNPGTGIFIEGPSFGNVVRGNQVLGNIAAHDIFDRNASTSANRYENNLCETSLFDTIESPAGICGVPNIAGHERPERDRR